MTSLWRARHAVCGVSRERKQPRSGNTFRAIDADVSALLVDEWAALARNGAPSAAWPRVTSDPAQTFVIASPTSVQAGVAEAECDVWDRVTALGL